MQDPFAAAPVSDEAQAVDGLSGLLEVGKASAEKAIAFAKTVTPAEGKVTVTLKGGVGYDAPWIVIHAADAAEANSQLDSTMLELMTKVQNAGKHFAGLYSPNVTTPAGPGPVYSNVTVSPSAPPPGATAPSNGETRSCQHGAMQYRTGVSAKTGKTWSAFMCPTPKGAPDQCAAEWIR